MGNGGNALCVSASGPRSVEAMARHVPMMKTAVPLMRSNGTPTAASLPSTPPASQLYQQQHDHGSSAGEQQPPAPATAASTASPSEAEPLAVVVRGVPEEESGGPHGGQVEVLVALRAQVEPHQAPPQQTTPLPPSQHLRSLPAHG